MTDAEIQERLPQYNFYHTIQLTKDLRTEGWPLVRPITDLSLRQLHGLDLKGRRVLDVGCRDGLFCFEAERQGAAEVIGIDNDVSKAAVEFLIPCLRSRVRMHELNLYDLRPQTFGKFDAVLFLGVLYHLRYPFWALKLLRDVLVDGGLLLLETGVLVDDNRHALLFCPIGDESPYEPTSCTFYNLKGLTDTLDSLGLQVHSVERLLNLEAAPGGLPAKPVIDRAVLACSYTPVARTDKVAAYWEGTHRIHACFQGQLNGVPAERLTEVARGLFSKRRSPASSCAPDAPRGNQA
jgi:SAM-dependent methyltransferase